MLIAGENSQANIDKQVPTILEVNHVFGSKRRQARRELAKQQETERLRQELLALIDKALQRKLTAEDCKRFEQLPHDDVEWQMWSDAREHVRTARALDEDRQRVRVRHRWLAEAENLEQRIYRLAEVITAYEEVHKLNVPLLEEKFGETRDQLQHQLTQMVRALYKTLLSERHQGPSQLERLGKLIKDARSYRTNEGLQHGRLKKAGAPTLSYPKDWNDLVARLYATPWLGMFVRQPQRDPGDVRLLADEAVRTRDFTSAQIALAYCNFEERYRVAVGDVLSARLARVVNRHRSRLAAAQDAVAADD